MATALRLAGKPRARRSRTPWALLAMCVACVACVACGSRQVPQQAALIMEEGPPPPASVAIGSDAGAPPASVGIAGTRIRGIRGTLNHDDVVQAMDARHAALRECIAARHGRSPVSGDIEFAFKVEPDGQPVDVRAVRSDIGHAALETCLMGVLQGTIFPRPAGRTRTQDLRWGTGVDTPYRPAEPLDPASLLEPLAEHRVAARELCEARKRYRYEITLYANRRGRVHSAGAVVKRGGKRAAELMSCLLTQVQTWKLPRNKHAWNKLTLQL